ncbi:MAG: amidohydrolase family protein, partial [Treponema sp.]|nr:amidohydrolase family protein [Treponema sp.]
YQNGDFSNLNIYIKDKKIVSLSTDKYPAAQTIDAKGKFVLPGFIDPHVHFNLGVGKNVSLDDFYNGSINAALGGVTTFIDFLDPVKNSEAINSEFQKRNELAKNSIVDYAFHSTIANPNDAAENIFEESLKVGINSVKLFTTYADTDRRTYDDYIFSLLKVSKENGGIVVIHAENDELINHSKFIRVEDHEKSRSSLCENVEVMKLAQMAKITEGKLYIVHVSAGSSVELLKNGFRKELDAKQIILESCPHYFILNSDSLGREDGYLYTMTPPLRPESDRILLNQNIDLISTIGTDHCPYTIDQKDHQYTSQIPMGIGGIKYSFLNMFSLFGFRILDKFTKGPAQAYGLTQKGVLLPGMDADVTIFDVHKKTTVTDKVSVYRGNVFKGAIDTVICGGNLCVHNGTLCAKEDQKGKYISRGKLNEGHQRICS